MLRTGPCLSVPAAAEKAQAIRVSADQRLFLGATPSLDLHFALDRCALVSAFQAAKGVGGYAMQRAASPQGGVRFASPPCGGRYGSSGASPAPCQHTHPNPVNANKVSRVGPTRLRRSCSVSGGFSGQTVLRFDRFPTHGPRTMDK